MKLGAVDFLEKPFDDEALLAAVRIGARPAREATATQERASAEVQRAARRRCRRASEQVLDGLVAGHPNKTIAFDLGISPRTVEVYRANVMTKMQARSLSDLVRMALDRRRPSERRRAEPDRGAAGHLSAVEPNQGPPFGTVLSFG